GPSADGQLLPCILGARIPLIGRWKMADNLRRTLSAPSAFLTLAGAWAMSGTSPATWTLFILATIAVPAFLPGFNGLLARTHGSPKRSHLRAVGRDVLHAVSQTAFVITMLAHQAWLMSD